MIYIEDSKTIQALDYDSKESKLLVRFKSGVWYEYYNVSEKEYEEIRNAESTGSTLKKVVQGKEYSRL